MKRIQFAVGWIVIGLAAFFGALNFRSGDYGWSVFFGIQLLICGSIVIYEHARNARLKQEGKRDESA